MTSRHTCEKILEDGLRSTNFFNGRRLTAEDLKREQEASRAHERLLGKAIGEGIVSGLEVSFPEGVTTGGTTVAITSGLAINRAGDALYLPKDIELSLVPMKDEFEGTGGFLPCESYSPKELPTGDGIYVLLMKPASGLEGSAPIAEMQPAGKISGCGKSDEVQGVKFRFAKLDIDGPAFVGLNPETKEELSKLIGNTDTPSVSRLRNIVAHACFGTEEKARFIADIFAPTESLVYGTIDRIRSKAESPTTVTNSDAPIAVLYWTSSYVTSIDIWSVRRRPYEIDSSVKCALAADARKTSEAEALMLQFQDHIAWLLEIVDEPSLVQAKTYFWYLPPVGLIPIQRVNAQGIHPETFFSPIPPYRPTPPNVGTDEQIIARVPQFMDGKTLGVAIKHALDYHPIPIWVEEAKLEMVWIHYAWQNVRAIEGAETQRHFLLFVTGHAPTPVVSRFDVARWDYSNYEKCECIA